MLIRVIDFETTGVPRTREERHAICEIGWCDIDTDAKTVSKPVSVLCNPGRPMPAEARAVHHLSDAMLKDCPSPDQGIRKMVENPPAVWVAHNAEFEQQFFTGASRPWICTKKVAYRIWPDAPNHQNQTLRYWLGVDLDDDLAMPPHRAAPDSYVTAHLLLKAIEVVDIEKMIEWSRYPGLVPSVHFGMHRGKAWHELPTDYLKWIVDKSDLDEEIKYTARHHLKAIEARDTLRIRMIDPLWNNAESSGVYQADDGKSIAMIRNAARTRVYAYLSAQLGIEVTASTLHVLSVEQCREAWLALKGRTYLDIRTWAKASEEKAA